MVIKSHQNKQLDWVQDSNSGLLTCPKLWDLFCACHRTGWPSPPGVLLHRLPSPVKSAEKHFPLSHTRLFQVHWATGNGCKSREASYLLNPEKHTDPPKPSSLLFPSSQGLRSLSYFLFSMLSSPPFPPGSYWIVCKISTSFLICYLCKTGLRLEIPLARCSNTLPSRGLPQRV